MYQACQWYSCKDPDEEEATTEDIRDAEDGNDLALDPEDHAADHEALAYDEVDVVPVPVVVEEGVEGISRQGVKPWFG